MPPKISKYILNKILNNILNKISKYILIINYINNMVNIIQNTLIYINFNEFINYIYIFINNYIIPYPILFKYKKLLYYN